MYQWERTNYCQWKNLNCPVRNGKLCIGVFYCEHAADSPVAVSDIKEWLAPKVVIWFLKKCNSVFL